MQREIKTTLHFLQFLSPQKVQVPFHHHIHRPQPPYNAAAMRRSHQIPVKSHTLPSSPAHSDFEFAVSLSPRKSSAALCHADELFYKGQLLPLHLSPRLSMVRTLLLSSASTSSCDTTTTASRDSTASSDSSADLLRHVYCDSSRPSSAAADDFKRPAGFHDLPPPRKPSRYFSLPKLSSVFRKENNSRTPPPPPPTASAVRRAGSSAREVIRRYLKKVKPLYEKLSQKQQQQKSPPVPAARISRSANNTQFLTDPYSIAGRKVVAQSFSGNLRYPRRRSSMLSCPSSPRQWESGPRKEGRAGCDSEASSMEELQSAIQGAIAHCKNSMMKNKNMVSD